VPEQGQVFLTEQHCWRSIMCLLVIDGEEKKSICKDCDYIPNISVIVAALPLKRKPLAVVDGNRLLLSHSVGRHS